MSKNNDFKVRIFLVALAFCITLSMPVMFNASANASQANAAPAAGSADDPLITLSYLNQAISFEAVELRNGQGIRARTNSVEIILRSGSATVVAPLATQGIGDYTAGVDLLNGENVPMYHLLLIPRADGRAISITSDVAFVMVRGDYEIY